MNSPVSSRDYLGIAFRTAKKSNPHLTIASYADKLGIGSSQLKMILSGKRKLTVHQSLAVAKALHLSEQETYLLETLALRDSAETPWERGYYSRRLERHEQSLPVRTILASDRELLTDPKAMPLLVYLMDLSQRRPSLSWEHIDFRKLGQQFGMEEGRIREWVVRFKDLGLLDVSADGRFHVQFDRMNHKLPQKKYMKRLLEEALKRVDTDYESKASSFIAYAFVTSDEMLARLRNDFRALMDKYLSESPPSEVPRHVSQACFQLFTVAKE